MHTVAYDEGVANVDEPTLAQRARTLIASGRVATLSTHSQQWPGYPFGSMVTYAVDAQGRPVFFLSSMAMHTQNLTSDMRASLTVMQPGAEDPLAAARLTLVGTVVAAPAEEVSELYLTRNENAREWADFADFAYYRMEVAAAYLIGGFGVMGWLETADYGAAL